MNNHQPSSVPTSGLATQEQAAQVIGVAPAAIPVLVKAGLLKPLGKPAPNGPKWFAATEVVQLAQDKAWLNRCVLALTRHWTARNRNRRNSSRSQTSNSNERNHDQ